MRGGGGSGLRLILGFFDRRGWVDAGAGLLLIIYFTNNTLILLKENKSQEKQTVFFFFFIIEWFFQRIEKSCLYNLNAVKETCFL